MAEDRAKRLEHLQARCGVNEDISYRMIINMASKLDLDVVRRGLSEAKASKEVVYAGRGAV